MRNSPFGALFVSIVLASCGGATSQSSTTASTGTDSTGTNTTGSADTTSSSSSTRTDARFLAPERPWAALDHEERAHHMSRHVTPAMSELFEAYDAERFGSFGCANCHGADARERHYAMPSPSLPVLYPTGSIGQHRAVAQYPEGVRFMYTQVTPAMRQLLGAPEFDEATHEGFTCFACHVRAADDDPLSQPE